MKKQKPDYPVPVAGEIFRCSDGVTRLITGISTRNYLRLLWLDTATGIWHPGGIMKPDRWNHYNGDAEKLPPMEPGTFYKVAGMDCPFRYYYFPLPGESVSVILTKQSERNRQAWAEGQAT